MGVIPVTICIVDLNKNMSDGIDFVLQKSRHQPVNYVRNNTFGFKWHMASSILKKFK